MRAIDLPNRLGEYNLIAPIDRGGMGEVWLASRSQEGLTKPCVLKILLPKFSRDPNYRRRFLREAEILAGLRHGRIVPVIGFGEDKGLLYLVMEFIDGVNLQTFFEALAHKGQRIPIVLVGYIIGEVLEALRHAHERIRDGYPRGVIHRDVKPSNVLITSEGEVLLTDFGIARYEAELSEEMFGTVAYMAPEQALGTATFQSDLFGASGLVHYMVTGEPPRKARNVAELHATINEPPRPTGRDDVPEPLERLRTLGLVPEVALRLESARAGLLLLERWDGYRKATTMTAEQYQRYVGPPHSGWTMLHRAAKAEATTKPDAPESASPSDDARDAEPPPQTEIVPEDDPAKHEESGQYVWKPWWDEGEDEDDVCEETATTRFIEPDAPRLFRRRLNPLLARPRGCETRTRAPSVTQRLEQQVVPSTDAGAIPMTERLPPPKGVEVQEGGKPSTEPSAAEKPSRLSRTTSTPADEPQSAEEDDAIQTAPRSPMLHGRAALRVAAASMLGALFVVTGMALATSESSADSNDGTRDQPAGIPASVSAKTHAPNELHSGEKRPHGGAPSAIQESPMSGIGSMPDESSVGAPASDGIADSPDSPSSIVPANAAAADLPAVHVESLPTAAEPEPAGETTNAKHAATTLEIPATPPTADDSSADPEIGPTPTPKPPRVRVLLVVDGVMKGEIRIGQGTVRSLQHLVALKLRPGWYPLSWREHASDPWRKVEALRVAVEDPASQYLYVRVTRKGTLIRAVKTKPKASRGR